MLGRPSKRQRLDNERAPGPTLNAQNGSPYQALGTGHELPAQKVDDLSRYLADEARSPVHSGATGVQAPYDVGSEAERGSSEVLPLCCFGMV